MAPAQGAAVTVTAPRRSPNVPRAFAFWFLNGCAQGLILGPTMTAYLYFVAGDSTLSVGIVEAVRGAANVVCGIPAGIVADRTSRSAVLRAAAAVMLLACAGTAVALFYRVHRVVLLSTAMGLFGAANGTFYAALEALFADSVPTGNRASVYAVKWQCNIASRGLGPAVAAVLFAVVGDTWRESEMRTVIMCGVGLALVPIALLTTLRDSWALGESSDAHERLEEPGGWRKGGAGAAANGSRNVKGEREPLLGLPAPQLSVNTPPKGRADGSSEHNALIAAHELESADDRQRRRDASRRRLIPVLIASADIVSGLASGMTVKFFSVWFIREVGLLPIAVSLIYAGSPLVTTAFVSAARRLAAHAGRVQVFVAFKFFGIALLLLLTRYPEFWASPRLVVPVYVTRTGLMNSPRFLMKGILMDYVPKENRGKWASVDLVTGFGWSGSAFLGGYLIHRFGWSVTFVATACTQATALLPVLLLLAIVPRREGSRRHDAAAPAT